jgi:hypothetical protein
MLRRSSQGLFVGFPECGPGYIPSGPCVRRPSVSNQPKADMDNLARVRRASIEVAKVQRRFWLLQTIFWPVVVIGGVVTAVAVGGRVWRRRNAAAETDQGGLKSRNGAGATNPIEGRLNGASSGNLSG